MMTKVNVRWIVMIALNVIALCVLGLNGTSGAAPQGGKQPFSNAVEQRHEMVRELKEIKGLLKEQNELLRTAAAKETQNGRQRE